MSRLRWNNEEFPTIQVVWMVLNGEKSEDNSSVEKKKTRMV